MRLSGVLALLVLLTIAGIVHSHDSTPVINTIPVSEEPGGHNETEICPVSLSDRNNLTTVTWFVIVVFILTILIEVGTEKLNHVRPKVLFPFSAALQNRRHIRLQFLSNPILLHWKQMSEHVYRELMILGLLSFLLFALTKWRVPTLIASIYNHNAAECEEEIAELIEEAHMALFILAILYMIVVVFVMILSKQIAETWADFERQAQTPVGGDDSPAPGRKCSLWLSWMLFPSRRDAEYDVYSAFRTDLIRSRKLDRTFSFNRYLKYCLADLCLNNLVDIHWGGWCFAGVLVLLNWIRNFIVEVQDASSVVILMASLAAAVQVFTLILYVWLNRIESKMLERCWPRNKSIGDDGSASSINNTADESTSLLSGFARFQPKKNKYKGIIDTHSRENSIPRTDTKGDKKDKKDKKKKEKKKDKDSSPASSIERVPVDSPAHVHIGSGARGSFALADGTTLADLEKAAKWEEEQLYGTSGIGEAIQFFKEASLKEDLGLFPFSRPGIFAHVLQLLLLGQAWYLGFCIYFCISFRDSSLWPVFLACGLSTFITVFVFAPNYLPKYSILKNVRGLARDDMIDRTWSRQQALVADFHRESSLK